MLGSEHPAYAGDASVKQTGAVVTDSNASFDVFRCPSCGKPTTESLPTCRHCHVQLRGENAGQKVGGIFDTSGLGGKWGCTGATLAVLLVAASGIGFCSHQIAESNRLKTEKEAAEQRAEEARYQERVRTGEVCADGPNNLNVPFQLHVKRVLKDPDSFEHIGTVITPSGDGRHYDALMRYRARNSLGGITIGTAIAKLYVAERNVCEVRSFRIADP